jgi:hypothetical protein
LDLGDNIAEYTDHNDDTNDGLLFNEECSFERGGDAFLNLRGSTSSIDLALEGREA